LLISFQTFCLIVNIYQTLVQPWNNVLGHFAHFRIIESAAYCNQIMLVPLYLNSSQNTFVNWIIQLLLSLLCWPKVIPLSGGHCIIKKAVCNRNWQDMVRRINCKFMALVPAFEFYWTREQNDFIDRMYYRKVISA